MKTKDSKALKMRLAWAMVTLALAACGGCTNEPVPALPQSYVQYPEALDPTCRTGTAKLFDECGDQVELFERARARAAHEGKVLLVEIGAEWCIWCHVFAAHLKGGLGRFSYTYGGAEEPDTRYTDTLTERDVPAAALVERLRDYVAEHFVVVHIDIEHAPRGYEVLAMSGALDTFPNTLPYVYTVDAQGAFVREFDGADAVKRRDGLIDWYRGYERVALLRELEALYESAAQ